MNKNVLGRTGLEVSELSLGGLFVSKFGAEFEGARVAVRRAVELGINYIDTAPGYANSEDVLGRCLEDVSQPLILSTKVGGRPDPFEPQNPEHLRRSVEESLRLLKRDTIDILMIHEPDRPGQYDWWTDPVDATGPVVDVLDELRKQGTIRFTGLGGTTTHELALLCDTGKFDVVLTAFNYSLLWQEAVHEVLPAATRHNMGIVSGSPLQQGALARRYDNEVESGCRWMSKPRRDQFKELYAFLDELDMPLAELSLRFVLSNPAFHSVLMGARNKEEVELNVAATDRGTLPEDVLKRLDEIHEMVPFRPFEEPFGLPMQGNAARPIGQAGR